MASDRCARCNCRLASDNPEPICAPCDRTLTAVMDDLAREAGEALKLIRNLHRERKLVW